MNKVQGGEMIMKNKMAKRILIIIIIEILAMLMYIITAGANSLPLQINSAGWTLTKSNSLTSQAALGSLLPTVLKMLLKKKYPGWQLLPPPVTMNSDYKNLVTGDFDGDSWNDFAMVLYKINPATSQLNFREVVFLFRDNKWEDHIVEEILGMENKSGKGSYRKMDRLIESKLLEEFYQHFGYGGLEVRAPDYYSISPDLPSEKMLLIARYHNLETAYGFEKGKFKVMYQSN